MKILGIDTASSIGSVGLIDGGKPIAEHTLDIRQAHSARLMPAIEQILKWADLKITEIDAIAVGVGPGSFTGVRIGVATAKSICFAVDKPIIGVSTLEAIAYNLRHTDRLICPIFDARRDEIYSALFRGGDRLDRVTDDLCVSLKQMLQKIDNSVIFVGDGLKRYRSEIEQNFDLPHKFADPTFNVPRGIHIAKIGLDRFQNLDDFMNITPNYVRSGDPTLK